MNPELTSTPGLDPVELSLLGGLVVVMLVALARGAWNRRMRRRSEEIDPFRVFPEDTVRRTMAPSPLHGLAWAPPASEGEDDDEPYRPAVVPPTAAVPQPTRPAAPARAAAPSVIPVPRRDIMPAPAVRAMPRALPIERRDEVDEASETIRLPTAADGTVQILPGTLTMTQGPEPGREYRFLRIGSQAVPEVTIGRVSGPPYRHIQLAAATVSRMHARIRYVEGRWWIANLSETNPVSLNGKEMRSEEEVGLGDGDRIQLGEVELSYRQGSP